MRRAIKFRLFAIFFRFFVYNRISGALSLLKCPLISPTHRPNNPLKMSSDSRENLDVKSFYPTKVAFQGEPGAYSEKCLKSMLGDKLIAVGCQTFEEVFKSVSNRYVDYALIPIENSLGGSIHVNYDLLMRYNLFIIGEYEFRVEHCLMALKGTKISDLKKVLSHEQALAQCENYIRTLDNVESIPSYDTAGSAKNIAENNLEGCAAIASELAAETYGLEILEHNIEDDHANFTRFILLSRSSVSIYLLPNIPAKTTVVFSLPNEAGALYKALSCFTLRDIDLTKIESRPSSSQLLQYLRKIQNVSQNQPENIPKFQYCFHLDFLAGEYDESSQRALANLGEVAPFMRILGSYPRKGLVVGPLKDTLDNFEKSQLKTFPFVNVGLKTSALQGTKKNFQGDKLKIGIIGFGKFGQFIGEKFAKSHIVRAFGRTDQTVAARKMGAKFFPVYEQKDFFSGLDVVLFSVSILSFQEVVKSIPIEYLKGKLIVEVLSVKTHPKEVLLENLSNDCDILCTHPMFGPESGLNGWQNLPFVYEKVRISNGQRADKFISIWEKERCKMVELTCEKHDEYAANSQFITHLLGRILGEQCLMNTPIDTRGFQNVLRLMETTCSDSFDLFYGLYKFNAHSHSTLKSLRESFAQVERQLAAKEAYVSAKQEMAVDERKKILSEVRELLQEAALLTKKEQD
mmetsp:Transcript_20144/g.29768  ORF Transcript_20144/g.29768 Transcript_20144/m.29768 type:complete len:687 (+) Transcript_20144:16-2076(+)